VREEERDILVLEELVVEKRGMMVLMVWIIVADVEELKVPVVLVK
jgi:hypothetical protein